MKLEDTDLMKLLPQYMKDDKDARAFVYAIERQLSKAIKSLDAVKVYTNIGGANSSLLDELAEQFQVAEYDKSYSLSTKRALIKNCLYSHYIRGTVASVQEAVASVYGNATIQEWFDYKGKPYHFKIYTDNPGASDEMIQDITKIVKETQNIRSVLEQVIVELSESMDLKLGIKARVLDIITLTM